MVGIMLSFFGGRGGFAFGIAVLGLVFYAAGILLTVVTLPVEFNASSRALAALTNYGIVASDEHTQTKKVLNAAAMTYVAAAIGAVLTFLYYAYLIFGHRE